MRGSVVRGPRALLAVLALLGLAGCGEAAADGGTTSQWPAAAAGGACHLLNYDTVAAGLGVRFDTAGSAVRDETYTCALTRAGQDYPYLTLAVTATTADEVIFTATVTPSGSTAVTGLGTIAYRIRLAGSPTSGPGIELGWLSGNGRIMIARYVFAPGTVTDEVEAFTPKLIALAVQIDQASG